MCTLIIAKKKERKNETGLLETVNTQLKKNTFNIESCVRPVKYCMM